MTVREAIRNQHQHLKNRTSTEKLSYFWEYYGIKVLCLLLCLGLVIAFIVSIVTKKADGYLGVFFGAYPDATAADFLEEFAVTTQIDTTKLEVTVQTTLDIRMDAKITDETYQAMQSFAAMVAASMVDNFAADADLFIYYAYLGYATDLRTVLTPAQLSVLAPYLYYIDGTLLRQQENADDSLLFAYGDAPEPHSPDAMSEPIPVGLDISVASELFRSSYQFPSQQTVIGICAGTDRPDTAAAFLKFAFNLV